MLWIPACAGMTNPDAVIPELRADHPWRKPRPGMLLAAQAELGLDLAGSVMVGNRWTDVGAALAAPVGHAVIVGPLARETPPSAQLASPLVVRCADLPEVTRWLEALPDQVPKA